jgi:hypothetical protein
MELIVGSFLLVVVSLIGHISFVIGSHLRRTKPVIEA